MKGSEEERGENTPVHGERGGPADAPTAIASSCCRAILSDCEENALRALSVLVDLARVSSSRMGSGTVHSNRSPNQASPSPSFSASPLPLAAELLSHTLPELYISVKAAIERQAEQCQTEGRAPSLGELPLGPLDRAKGQLVPATLSIRVTGDVAYCLLALCTRLPMMLVLLQHPQPLQKLLQLMLDFALMEIPGSSASPWPGASLRSSSTFQAGRTVFYDFLYAQTRILFLFCYLLKNAPNPPFSLSSASTSSSASGQTPPLSSPSRVSSSPTDDSAAAVSALANFLARGAAPALPNLILRLLRLLSPPFLFKRKTVHESLKLLVSSPRFRWLVAPYLQDILTNELAAATGSTDAPMLRAYAFSNIHELLVAFASDLQAWDTSFLSALLRAVGGAFNCDFSRAFGTGAVGEGITPGLGVFGQNNGDGLGCGGSGRIRRVGGGGGGGGETGPGGEKVSVATFLHTRQLLVKIVSYVVEVGVKKAHQAGATQGAKAAAEAVAEVYDSSCRNDDEYRAGRRGDTTARSDGPAAGVEGQEPRQLGGAGPYLTHERYLSFGDGTMKASGESEGHNGSKREGNASSMADISPAVLATSWRDVRGGLYGARVDDALDAVRMLLRQAVEILGLSLKTLRAMIPELYAQAAAIAFPPVTSPASESPSFYPPFSPFSSLLVPFHENDEDSVCSTSSSPFPSPFGAAAFDALSSVYGQRTAQQPLPDLLREVKALLRTTAVGIRCALYYRAVLGIEVDAAAAAASEASAHAAHTAFSQLRNTGGSRMSGMSSRLEGGETMQLRSVSAASARPGTAHGPLGAQVDGDGSSSALPGGRGRGDSGVEHSAITPEPTGPNPVATAVSAGVAAASAAVARMAFDVRLLPRGEELSLFELEVVTEAFFDGVMCAVAYGRLYANSAAPCLLSCMRCGGSGCFTVRAPDLPALLSKAASMAAHDQAASATGWASPPIPPGLDECCGCCASGEFCQNRNRKSRYGDSEASLSEKVLQPERKCGVPRDVGCETLQSVGKRTRNENVFGRCQCCSACLCSCCCSSAWAGGGVRGNSDCRAFLAEQQGYNELVLSCAQGEEREAVEVVASSLTFLHPFSLRDFAQHNVRRLYGLTCLHPGTINGLQFFFAHQHTCIFFAEALLGLLLPSLSVLSDRKFALLPPLLPSSPLYLHLSYQATSVPRGFSFLTACDSKKRRSLRPGQNSLSFPWNSSYPQETAFFYYRYSRSPLAGGDLSKFDTGRALSGNPGPVKTVVSASGNETDEYSDGACQRFAYKSSVDANRERVYRQFDAAKLLCREAGVSDLLMAAGELQTALRGGDGVFVSLGFPHAPTQRHHADCCYWRQSMEKTGRGGMKRETNHNRLCGRRIVPGEIEACAPQVPNKAEGQVVPRQECGRRRQSRSFHGYALERRRRHRGRFSDGDGGLGAALGRCTERGDASDEDGEDFIEDRWEEKSAIYAGFSSQLRFLADVFDVPSSRAQDKALLASDRRLDLLAAAAGVRARKRYGKGKATEKGESRGDEGEETRKREEEEEALAFSVWEGPQQQEQRQWMQEDTVCPPPSCLPSPLPASSLEGSSHASSFLPSSPVGDPRLTETSFSLRTSLYLRCLLPTNSLLSGPATPPPVTTFVYPVSSIPPPQPEDILCAALPTRDQRSRPKLSPESAGSTCTCPAASSFSCAQTVTSLPSPLGAPPALDAQDAAEEAVKLLSRLISLQLSSSQSASRWQAGAHFPADISSSPPSSTSFFPSFPRLEKSGTYAQLLQPVDTAHVVSGEDSLLYTSTGYARMTEASTHLRLYRYLLKAIVTWPECESRLTREMLLLCRNALSLAVDTPQPYLLLGLLRALFRQTTPSGRTGCVYTAFLPFLPAFLATSLALQRAAGAAVPLLRNLWVEVCLMAPARLKNLLQHLPFLVHPVLTALSCGDPEVVTLALRTVELWIENLHGDYIYPILATQFHSGLRAETRPPLLVALVRLLQQSPVLASACCGPLPPVWRLPCLRVYHAAGAAETEDVLGVGATTAAGSTSGIPGGGGGGTAASMALGGGGLNLSPAVIGGTAAGGQRGHVAGSFRGGVGGGGSPLLLMLPQMVLGAGGGVLGGAAGALGAGAMGGPSGLVQWVHLQQQQEKHALMVMRILGKLGGKNRAFLKLPHVCSPRPFFGNALVLGLPLEPRRRGKVLSSPVGWLGAGERRGRQWVPSSGGGMAALCGGEGPDEKKLPFDTSRVEGENQARSAPSAPRRVRTGVFRGGEALSEPRQDKDGEAHCTVTVAGLDMDEILKVVVGMLEAAEASSQAAYLYHAGSPPLTPFVFPRHLARTQEQAFFSSDVRACKQHCKKQAENRGRGAHGETTQSCASPESEAHQPDEGVSQALRVLKSALKRRSYERNREETIGQNVEMSEIMSSGTHSTNASSSGSEDEDDTARSSAEEVRRSKQREKGSSGRGTRCLESGGEERGRTRGQSANTLNDRDSEQGGDEPPVEWSDKSVSVCEGCIALFYRKQATKLLQLALLALLDLRTPLSAFWLACVNKAAQTFACPARGSFDDPKAHELQRRLTEHLADNLHREKEKQGPGQSEAGNRGEPSVALSSRLERLALYEKLRDLQRERNFAGDRALPTVALRPLFEHDNTEARVSGQPETAAASTPTCAAPLDSVVETAGTSEGVEVACADFSGAETLVCADALPGHKAALRTRAQRQAEQVILQVVMKGLLLLSCDEKESETLQKRATKVGSKQSEEPNDGVTILGSPQSDVEMGNEGGEDEEEEEGAAEEVGELSTMDILRGVLRHSAFICAARIYSPAAASLFSPAAMHEIDPINLLRALQPALSVEPSRLLPTLRVVQLIEEAARTFILVQPHTVSEGVSSFFASSLCDVYAHLCFEESWRAKAAGCLVLTRLLRTLPPEWAQRNLVKIAEAAFFVSKDATAAYAPVAQLLASECLVTLFTVAFCGYAGPVRLPFLQLAFGIQTSPLWGDCGSGKEEKRVHESKGSSGDPNVEDDVEMMDVRLQESKTRKGETKVQTACETDLLGGCDVPVGEKEGEDGSEFDQYEDDMKRFVFPPTTFLRSLRLAAEGVVFRVLSSSSVTSEADIEAAERLGRTLVPPPIPESDPVSYRSRRSRPANTPWWMKRSEWLTWQKLNSGAGGCSTVSDLSCDSTNGTQNVSFPERQGSAAPLSLPMAGQGEGSSGSRVLMNGQSIPDDCSSSSQFCSVCTSELSWRPAEELRPAVCRILEKLLIPNLYQVRTECRRLGQRLFLLLPRLLGTDAAALLGGADENLRALGGGGGSGKSAGDQSQNAGRNEGPRSFQQEQTAGALDGDSGQQTPGPLRRSESQSDRVSSSTGGEKKDICTLPLPVSALTRVLKWVTLRPVALLTLQWQVAFLDCICFLAALRPAPSALRPALEQDLDLGILSDQTAAKAGRVETEEVEMEEVKREGTSLTASAGSRDSNTRRERGGSLMADAGTTEAASVVCWLIEDALAVLAKGLETEAACFPSPVLVSVADEEGRGNRGQAGAFPSGGPESKQQQTDGSGPGEGDSTKERCEDGNKGGDDSDLKQKERALQEAREEDEVSRSQRGQQDTRDGNNGSAALAGDIPENEEESKTASRVVQAVLHNVGTTESGRRGVYEGQSTLGNTSGGIVIDEAYTSTLLLALRFIKLALIHPEWQGLLGRPRLELQKLAQASRGFGVDSGLGGHNKQEGNKRTSATTSITTRDGPGSHEGEKSIDKTEDAEEGGLLLDKTLSGSRPMREHCAATLA
ncbi:non-specific serine threonine protein kinase, partial [Cystoisospora suis]